MMSIKNKVFLVAPDGTRQDIKTSISVPEHPDPILKDSVFGVLSDIIFPGSETRDIKDFSGLHIYTDVGMAIIFDKVRFTSIANMARGPDWFSLQCVIFIGCLTSGETIRAIKCSPIWK